MAVWISKESWLTVWNALHDIRIAHRPGVVKGAAALSGNGTSARINIELPELPGGNGNGLLTVSGGKMERGTPVALTGALVSGSPRPELDNCLNLCYAASAAQDQTRPWGILATDLAASGRAEARFSGIAAARVELSSADHRCAVPYKGALVSADTGGAEILYKQTATGNALCLLRLGGGGSAAYDGPFAVSFNEDKTLNIAAGYLLRNGELIKIDEQQNFAFPTAGIVCLKSTIQETGGWTKPQYVSVGKDSSLESESVPIAEIDNGEIRQITYGVAVMMVTKRCPMAEY